MIGSGIGLQDARESAGGKSVSSSREKQGQSIPLSGGRWKCDEGKVELQEPCCDLGGAACLLGRN